MGIAPTDLTMDNMIKLVEEDLGDVEEYNQGQVSKLKDRLYQ